MWDLGKLGKLAFNTEHPYPVTYSNWCYFSFQILSERLKPNSGNVKFIYDFFFLSVWDIKMCKLRIELLKYSASLSFSSSLNCFFFLQCHSRYFVQLAIYRNAQIFVGRMLKRQANIKMCRFLQNNITYDGFINPRYSCKKCIAF